MTPDGVDVSVVVATCNRRDRIAELLVGLREQTLPRERFEVIVVDDGSSDGTAELLGREASNGELKLRPVHLERNSGPSVARNLGWREARGGTIAFTDDDCVPDPGWLEAGVHATKEHPGAIVQGPTIPSDRERARLPALARPFAHTLEVLAPDPHLQTCNVFYPRELLEQMGGFDAAAFARNMAEDADLAWRAIEHGARTAFAPDARVTHAYVPIGPIGKLRRAAGSDLKVYALHPGLRRAWFTRRVFWHGRHYLLARALIATLVPRRLLPMRVWLALPYVVHLVERGRVEGGGPALAPYYLVHDLLEMGAAVRESVRYRVPML